MGELGWGWGALCALALVGCGGGATPENAQQRSSALTAPGDRAEAQSSSYLGSNENGVSTSLRVGGGPLIDPGNPFFQVLGTNGRTCATCHVPEDNYSVTPQDLQARFEATGGRDPIFHENDGTDSPLADRSTVEARRRASSQLLSRGTIRIGLPIPQGADFELVAVDDPYGYASAEELSLFRRPLPSTNLDLASVMLDGRETFFGESLRSNLKHQALDATMGHAQAAQPPSDAQLEAMVDYETQLFTAQTFSNAAGALHARGAEGGPFALSQQPFYEGINGVFGDSRTGAPFDPQAITIFDAWTGASGGGEQAARAAIARGEAIFNTRPIQLTGVAGLNDNPAFGRPAVRTGTCSTCHNAPNVGNESSGLAFDLGISEAQPVGALDVQGLPRYTLRSKSTGETRVVTDPGVALISGRFEDVGKFKTLSLRGLSGRAPYFHNGSAHTLADVVRFYGARFHLGLTEQERSDLIAFLASL